MSPLHTTPTQDPALPTTPQTAPDRPLEKPRTSIDFLDLTNPPRLLAPGPAFPLRSHSNSIHPTSEDAQQIAAPPTPHANEREPLSTDSTIAVPITRHATPAVPAADDWEAIVAYVYASSSSPAPRDSAQFAEAAGGFGRGSCGVVGGSRDGSRGGSGYGDEDGDGYEYEHPHPNFLHTINPPPPSYLTPPPGIVHPSLLARRHNDHAHSGLDSRVPGVVGGESHQAIGAGTKRMKLCLRNAWAGSDEGKGKGKGKEKEKFKMRRWRSGWLISPLSSSLSPSSPSPSSPSPSSPSPSSPSPSSTIYPPLLPHSFSHPPPPPPPLRVSPAETPTEPPPSPPYQEQRPSLIWKQMARVLEPGMRYSLAHPFLPRRGVARGVRGVCEGLEWGELG
ncbi:hypothetical protein EKO04_009896 [Ascochyta lentis]|uniref:Uncharacterized protein n=1 Tax=Ascochyta lentis TaxID=205686 RepID=A0A8H7MBT1_9PLEO|nr:hypothetical protein EKO04_009896 [Ascochyta lentis]